MKKLFTWCKNNVLFLLTLFLLAFIPLYPKLPLLDVKHVWVYVRVEDFIVLFALACWAVVAVRNKGSLRTPLTIPILLFWLTGAAATLHGMLLIFPGLANVYANVAFLSFLRHIEYLGLFFIAYSSITDRRLFSVIVAALVGSLFLVISYGIGQKYLGFPAFLTMNEEVAKGIAIQLSPLSRVSSTFAGHYDLAAYLVLVLPIMVSLMFGYRNWMLKMTLLSISMLGFWVLFMTVSRISFFALFVSLGLVILFQKKKLVLLAIPVIAVLTALLLIASPSLLSRFGSTIKEIDVLVDATTGNPVGHVREAPKTYFEHKVVLQQFSQSITNFSVPASPSAIFNVPFASIPEKVILLAEPSAPTGEDLPQGTGYINLSLSPVVRRIGSFYYEPKPNPKNGADVFVINGQFLLKKALAYDLSFTTRFQGEWPNAFAAFQRNVFLGSGYGSVSLAVDNNYLRMLAETGILGFASFLAIFIGFGIYLKKTLPNIESRPAKSFLFGVAAGIVGLGINALFIDVFEASKVAFVLWLLVGVSMGIAHVYSRITLDMAKELKHAATSPPAIILYLLVATIVLFSPMTRNYFVGDDFTWFRWAADCGNSAATTAYRCPPAASTIVSYFTHSQGFFYRPGAKLYFLLMFWLVWLNQTVYHIVSLALHFAVAALVYLLAKKIFKNGLLPALTALLFLLLTGYSEAVFWISATGFLFTTLFSLASLLMFATWLEQKNKWYLGGALVFFVFSLLFHELGIVTPFLFLLYAWTKHESLHWKSIWNNRDYQFLFLPIPLYLLVRFAAGSLWFGGDYSYNILKFPLNAIGNSIGYFFLTVLGPPAMPVYQMTRINLRDNTFIAVILVAFVATFVVFFGKKIVSALSKHDSSILLFGPLFFIIALLPFLGLGNITSRYSYFASIGTAFVITFAIEKLYTHLLGNGRSIALGCVAVTLSVFCLFQVTQLRQLHGDWYEAGEKSRRVFVAMGSAYLNEWATEPVELHFVNVPIRFGEAWIFPVGIPDALWVVFRNPNLKVYTWSTLSDAMNVVTVNSKTQKIFVFDQDGNVTEVRKTSNTQ